jgi:HAD superfamily hydrolase (TIGR01459 family)
LPENRGQGTIAVTEIIERLADISDRYETLLVDLWGCVHNGLTAFPDAVAALRDFRERGGAVVLLTNAPRSRHEVAKQLVKMNVPEDCYDTIVTSGDSARAAMFEGVVGRKVWFVGTNFDLTFFEPLRIINEPVEITRVDLKEAEGIVCTGPFDPSADPAELRPQLLYAKQKGLEMICANPDIVVDRGDRREWCAGALAKLYTEMGGVTHYFGKPHPPIYDLAYRRIGALGRGLDKERMLAIGDGAHTDIPGAMGEDVDSLFISGGLAAADTKTGKQPDPAALETYLGREQISPTYTIGFLR